MSRNKDIMALHLITNEPYSVCRARMKRNKWNFAYALLEDKPIYQAIKASDELRRTFIKTLNPVIEKAAEVTKELAKLLREAQEEENAQKFNNSQTSD